MKDERWTTVTESQFEHERRGLEAIRRALRDQDGEPWRAWSNFTFTANSGHVREVDLFMVAPAGVFLIELKDWHGSVAGGGRDWIQTTPGGTNRRHSNPLHLSNQKAKELAGLVQSTVGARPRIWVGEAVCFTDDRLRLNLPAADLNGVFTVRQLAEMLATPPGDARYAVTAEISRKVAQGLQSLGIAPIRRQEEVGGYLLDSTSFDSGRTWADYRGEHTQLHDIARVRVFLSERGASNAERASVEKAAAREAAVLNRFRHPGAVSVKNYLPSGHPAGPAILFDYHPHTMRLDDYLVSHGQELDLQARLALVRQLAETIRSAHSRRIYHRALSAHCVHVIPRNRGARGHELTEAEQWARPRLEIADWQIAAGGPGAGASRGSASGGGRRLSQMMSPTSLSALHIADQADPYLAPELTAAKADPVRLDVYGLGVLTYLLVTGRPRGRARQRCCAGWKAGRRCGPVRWSTAWTRTLTTWWRRRQHSIRSVGLPRSTTSWRCWSSSSRRSRPWRPLGRMRMAVGVTVTSPALLQSPSRRAIPWSVSRVMCSRGAGRSSGGSAPDRPRGPSSYVTWPPSRAVTARGHRSC